MNLEPTPTLCLVMDGERIVSYKVATTENELNSFLSLGNPGIFTVLAVPLSLCALVPEMKEALAYLLEAHLNHYIPNPEELDEALKLLSRAQA